VNGVLRCDGSIRLRAVSCGQCRAGSLVRAVSCYRLVQPGTEPT
jgi:hypothetical protein